MGKIRFNITMSLDGYVAGPNQTEKDPLGVGGMDLHNWLIELELWREAHGEHGGKVNAGTRAAEELETGYGAVVMGRIHVRPGSRPVGGGALEGMVGENPPFHTPLFVLTHHQREPLQMEGGTTFHFITDGMETALERARLAAGEKDVLIAGGQRDPAIPARRPDRRVLDQPRPAPDWGWGSVCSTTSAVRSG